VPGHVRSHPIRNRGSPDAKSNRRISPVQKKGRSLQVGGRVIFLEGANRTEGSNIRVESFVTHVRKTCITLETGEPNNDPEKLSQKMSGKASREGILSRVPRKKRSTRVSSGKNLSTTKEASEEVGRISGGSSKNILKSRNNDLKKNSWGGGGGLIGEGVGGEILKILGIEEKACTNSSKATV